MPMRRLLNLPLLVILMGIATAAMLVPAGYAFAHRDFPVGRAFAYATLIFSILTGVIGLATGNRQPRDARHSHLKALVGAYLVLPLMLAVPLNEAVRDTSFVNAWFEMLSSFTTTGATVYEMPGRLSDALHLWRALVGWLGGFFILLMGVAVLLPMNLGGMEVLAGRGTPGAGAPQITRIADPSQRVTRFAVQLFPVYAAFTLALWIGLVMLGESGFRGLCLAMATISTSGILPGGTAAVTGAGIPGEILIALFLLPAITRRAYPAGPGLAERARSFPHDPELRMATAIVVAVTGVLFLRHWVGAIENAEGQNLVSFLRVLWGTAFTTLSFLTTTGLPSSQWAAAQLWSGLETHGLILLGLAMIGGGVATTAGGVKLLRVYALFRHGQREMERLIHPHSIGGQGPVARRLRGEGARLAWVFFMLFAVSIAVIVAALTLTGQGFDQSLILAISALSTTGPIASFAGESPVLFSALGTPAKLVLGFAMVLGRVEALALLALLAPEQWRK